MISSASEQGAKMACDTAGAYSAGWAEGVRKGAVIAANMKQTPVKPKEVAKEILKVLVGME